MGGAGVKVKVQMRVVHHVHRRLLAAAQPAGVVADMLWAHQQGFQELLGGLKDWYLRHQAEVLAAAEDSVRQLSVAAPSLMYDLHCATVRQADRRHPSGAHRDYVAATVAAITTTSAPILAGNRAPAGTPARASADAVHRREAREREWRRERRRPGWQREARRRLAVAAGWCSAVLFGREEEAEGRGRRRSGARYGRDGVACRAVNSLGDWRLQEVEDEDGRPEDFCCVV
ncbi:hypothetical protein PLESTM_000494100 [Pleodorina starrii]|nr:hypothetical protein PLESTM_000494100 [Pleodorina starrii]